MKKYIERMLLTLVGIFLMFTICAAEAHADLLYEPDDDFYEAHREEWAVKTSFTYPGAIQYFGPTEVCDLTTRTLALEKGC